MTPAPRTLIQVLDGVRRALRRETALAVVFSALCAVPAALLIAWLLGLVRPWRYPGFGPLALDVLVIGGAAALTYFGTRRWLGRLDESAVAADVERSAGMTQGSVRGALELSRTVPDGTSSALARRAGEDLGRRFSGIAPDSIAATLRHQVRRRRRVAAGTLATLSLTAVLLAFVAPEHSRAAWAPMASPVRNLTPPALPALDVQPGDAEVQRGVDLSVRITAAGRTAVTAHWRMEGDVPRSEVVSVVGDSATAVIPRIDSAAEYWVEAPDGATSARYTITPADPLLLADLSVDVVYPPHVARVTDHYQGDVPPLEIPEGTQLLVRGRATRALDDAGLQGVEGSAASEFAVSGERFSGSFTPRVSGTYTWRLRDVAGGDVALAPVPLHITLLADAAPHVEITFPVSDTVLDASLRQAVVADASDDFGLADAALVSWRVSGAGEAGAQVVEPIRMTGDDRALIRGLLDASTRDLVPGDTLKFFIRVTDTSPRGQSAVSRTVSLRLPGRVELRERSLERANDMVSETERLAQTAGELQRTTRDLERRASAANARRAAERQQRGGSNSTAAGQKMDYQEASAARQMLERQDELVEQLEDMRSRLQALERAMEQSGLRDAELQERLQELRELQQSMLAPEMREQMEALRQALEELDPEALQQALEQMAQQQEQLKQQLDESLQMMRRAAVEQQMNSLAQEARELATQQEALAESMAEQQPTPAQADAQQEMAERAGDLSRSLEEMQHQLQEQGEQQTAESAGEAQQNSENAAQQMRQAAADAARKDGAQAAEKGSSAAQQLEQAAETLDRAREALAEQWKQDAQQSLEQATRDALSLAERQQQLLDRMKAAEQGQQGADQPQPQQGQQQGSQQGQQQGGQQQGQQQGGQQQGGQQQGGQQQGGQQGQQQGGQQQGQQPGGQMPGQRGGGGSGSMESMRSEQGALQQGLQQLGRNLQENGERSGALNQDVSASLGRANRSMQQTLEQMQGGQLPTDQAQQTVDALNRLALSLLNNSQSMGEQSGEGSQALQQMADIAKKQGDLNGRSNALTPMDVTQAARGQQLNRLAQEQMEIARRLGELNRGGAESMMGDIDALAQEAEQIAREMQSGRMPPETVARQERLFHRMLDAGRSLEKDEVEDERSAERPGGFDARAVDGLDPALFADPNRFRAPDAAELQSLPPAYRRLILDYFERLNRQDARQQGRSPGG